MKHSFGGEKNYLKLQPEARILNQSGGSLHKFALKTFTPILLCKIYVISSNAMRNYYICDQKTGVDFAHNNSG
jgi:hypothetical protein